MRNALRAHIGLVEEDAAKVVSIGKHLVLVGQVGAARVHQINTGQAVLLRHLLGTQMLFHGERVVGAAFDGGVVAHDHAVDTADAANARNQTSARGIVAVHVERSQRSQFQKRCARVQQHADPVPRQQLAARHVFGARRLAATLLNLLHLKVQVVHQGAHGLRVGHKVRSAWVELGV